MTANSVSNAPCRHGIDLPQVACGVHELHPRDKEQARALADQLAALANGLAKADSNVTTMMPGAAAK